MLLVSSSLVSIAASSGVSITSDSFESTSPGGSEAESAGARHAERFSDLTASIVDVDKDDARTRKLAETLRRLRRGERRTYGVRRVRTEHG